MHCFTSDSLWAIAQMSNYLRPARLIGRQRLEKSYAMRYIFYLLKIKYPGLELEGLKPMSERQFRKVCDQPRDGFVSKLLAAISYLG